MYTELFWLILVFGIAVLLTYVHLMDSNSLHSLVKPIPLKIWIPSMALTVASFIYMANQWIWHLPADATVLGMYAIFFTGAVLWAPLTADALHREEKTPFVAIALWLAATGSVGLLVLSCSHPEVPWLIVASAWFMIHHVFVDAIVWFVRWHIHGATTAMFSMGVETGQEVKYNSLEYI